MCLIASTMLIVATTGFSHMQASSLPLKGPRRLARDVVRHLVMLLHSLDAVATWTERVVEGVVARSHVIQNLNCSPATNKLYDCRPRLTVHASVGK